MPTPTPGCARVVGSTSGIPTAPGRFAAVFAPPKVVWSRSEFSMAGVRHTSILPVTPRASGGPTKPGSRSYGQARRRASIV